MTSTSGGATPIRNALAAALPAAVSGRASALPSPAAVLLARAIGHAAALSDTPEKWASTIEMLRRNGVDPEGYESFEKGRPAALAASGYSLNRREPEDDAASDML